LSVKSAPAAAAGLRRSSRKSINGLIIEFDLEDEDEVNLFADCDDYKNEYKACINDNADGDSVEELRTKLEVLEHEPESLLPEYYLEGKTQSSLGEECVHKQMLEALEGSMSHSIVGAIREGDDDEDEEQDYRRRRAHTKGGGDEEKEEITSLHDHSYSSQQQRRSTVRSRSSILGLVMEYDWTTDDEEDSVDLMMESASC